MTDEGYLEGVLASQRFGSDDAELNDLRAARDGVEKVLRKQYGSKPSIRYGGSYAKGTMIKASYDLDILCYFAHDDESAGKTLKEIHASVKKTLEADYIVDEKRSALRLRSREKKHDFHIDVVPGRFVDDEKSDVFLFQSDGDKDRLKTNPNVHIDFVKDSGATDIIAMLKYWRHRYSLDVKTFVLELAVIDALKGSKAQTLLGCIKHVFTDFRDTIDDLVVTDPANPTGNDLSPIWSQAVRSDLKATAKQALAAIDKDGWEAVFGKLATKDAAARLAAVRAAPERVSEPNRPWAK